jgi:hypothetical protein
VKRLILLAAVILAALSSAAMPFEPAPAFGGRCPERLGMYDGYETPAWILRGIALAESEGRDSAVGDGGISLGRMQINELYRAQRVAAWGEYDPQDPNDAIRIASCIFQDNLKRLGNTYLAICAHRQGAGGVERNGPTFWYVERVIERGRT